MGETIGGFSALAAGCGRARPPSARSLWRRPTSASITAGERFSRRTMARAWAGPCVRATMIRRSSSRQGEEVRNGAAIAIGWLAMKLATARGTVSHWESAATASRLASSLDAGTGGEQFRELAKLRFCRMAKPFETADRRHQYKVLLPLGLRPLQRAKLFTHGITQPDAILTPLQNRANLLASC